MQISRHFELSHSNRICILQDNRVAYYRRGCHCPEYAGMPQFPPTWLLLAFCQVGEKSQQLRIAQWKKTTTVLLGRSLDPASYWLAPNNQLSAGASLTSIFSFFPFRDTLWILPFSHFTLH